MPAPKSPFRLGMASLAIIGLLAMPTAAVAVDDEATAQLKHFADCLKWLLTDLPMHEANCTPSRVFHIPATGPTGGPAKIGPIVTTSAWTDSCDPSTEECPSTTCEPYTQECPQPCPTCEEQP